MTGEQKVVKWRAHHSVSICEKTIPGQRSTENKSPRWMGTCSAWLSDNKEARVANGNRDGDIYKIKSERKQGPKSHGGASLGFILRWNAFEDLREGQK